MTVEIKEIIPIGFEVTGGVGKKTFVDLVYEVMTELHRQYCNYPCFSKKDVEKALSTPQDEWISEHQGTSIVALGQHWGNVSWEHFTDCFYRTLNIILEEIEKYIEIVR